MESVISRGQARLRPHRLAIPRKPERKKWTSYLPYILLAALAAIAILILLLELMPDEPETPAVAFSCLPSFQLIQAAPFAIDTNSTIQSLTLDTRARIITIGVEGPTGSTGVFCINVPKDMFGDRITATIDNLPANARVEDYRDSKIVSLVYSHSERTIVLRG